jgi:hypothetical protein
MSALPGAPRRRLRPIVVKRDDEVVRGAPAEALDRPAGELLESLRWEGPDPDPDSLAAEAFLSWL